MNQIKSGDKSKRFKFTPKNLLKNLNKLGPWSSYALAVDALMHYFPDEYDEDGHCELDRDIRS